MALSWILLIMRPQSPSLVLFFIFISRTVMKKLSLILCIIVTLGAACSYEPLDSSSSSLKGVSDRNHLLRLAPVLAPANRESPHQNRSYRFESCDVTGTVCTGAFKDKSGRDVLINLQIKTALDDDLYNVDLIRSVDEYFTQNLDQAQFKTRLGQGGYGLGTALLIAGTVSAGLGAVMLVTQKRVGEIIGPLLVLFSGLGGAISGDALKISGGRLYREAVSERKQDQQQYDQALQASRQLPIFLSRGVFNADQTTFIADSSRVYWMSFALAKHLNDLFYRQSHKGDPSIIEHVCFVKGHDEQACERLNL